LAVPGHCPRCETYEATVMARRPGEPMPASISPCKDYAMSPAFRDWAVAQMQKDMARQVSASGLDRVAVLKSREPADEPEQDGGRK
jgi:hypothetical protein